MQISFVVAGLPSTSLRCMCLLLINQFTFFLLLIAACQMQAIGLASNDTLPDASFSASTERTNLEAFKGRLNAYSGWSPSRNDRRYDYLQIDLQYEFLICAVATQGRSTFDDWTTEYKLQLSLDGSTFVTYKENNVDKVG